MACRVARLTFAICRVAKTAAVELMNGKADGCGAKMPRLTVMARFLPFAVVPVFLRPGFMLKARSKMQPEPGENSAITVSLAKKRP